MKIVLILVLLKYKKNRIFVSSWSNLTTPTHMRKKNLLECLFINNLLQDLRNKHVCKQNKNRPPTHYIANLVPTNVIN
jgi:hypothetical protein